MPYAGFVNSKMLYKYYVRYAITVKTYFDSLIFRQEFVHDALLLCAGVVDRKYKFFDLNAMYSYKQRKYFIMTTL